MIRDNFNFPVLKAADNKMHTKLFAENEKIFPQNEGKSISEHLKSKFSQESMPPDPPTSFGPMGPSYTPFGRVC